jgi:hypothetical protein
MTTNHHSSAAPGGFRLVKTIEHTMETLFLIGVDDAVKLLPPGFRPYTFLGRGLLQLSALKYSDLKFEGRSLGPCTDVYFAVAVNWPGMSGSGESGGGLLGSLRGYCPYFYNNSEQIVHLVNSNWFFNKKYAAIDWKTVDGRYAVSVTLNGERILDYSDGVPSSLLVRPVLQRTRHALTLSNGTVYAFDNIFAKRFGAYSRPQIQTQNALGWFTDLRKLHFYSIMWFNDTLKISNAIPVALQEGNTVETLPSQQTT